MWHQLLNAIRIPSQGNPEDRPGPTGSLIFGLITTVALAGIVIAARGNASSNSGRATSMDAAGTTDVPVLSPEHALETFSLPPDFRAEVVAAEPLVEDPVDLDIGPDGRLWVVEMRGYMRNLIDRTADYQHHGQIVVLEDTNRDGRMDHKTVFLDSLILPRSVLVTGDGVLVGEPPHLWLVRDTDGDLRADEKHVIRDDYGSRDANPELLPNSLVWGLDNWVHTSHYAGRLRRTGEGWAFDSTLALGQWGLTMDNHGRFFRMHNSDPLVVSMLDPHYYVRNPNLMGAAGANVSIARGARTLWPGHATEGVNRGYRDQLLREDSSLTRFTAASGGAAYRGDRYPETFQEDVFVPEPAANMIRRFEIIERADGSLKAVNAYDRKEFMTSTDERFRPVNLASTPDGTLYVVDMYRGAIQHRNFLSQYLKDHIREHELAAPLGLGRIYRIVYEPNPPREEHPQLTGSSDRELTERLADPNGWWRDTAQQLLVERGALDVQPTLEQMVRSAESPLARLHALWTLDGMGVLSFETVRHALKDEAPAVRSAAVRTAEPWLRKSNNAVLRQIFSLTSDPAPSVRLQLAASLGEVPPPEADPAIVDLLTRAAAQPYLTEAVISGLEEREMAFLRHLLEQDDWTPEEAGYRRVIRKLAATAVNGNKMDAINELLRLTVDPADRPRWQRLALLDGIAAHVPESRSGTARTLKLSEKPEALQHAVEASDPAVRGRAVDLAERLVWPGKPGYDAADRPRLTAEEKKRFKEGRQHYMRVCSTCHLADGTGGENVAASLVGSEWVVGQPKDVTRIVLDGKEGTVGVMPPHRSQLTDEEIAAILTYIRRAWGHEASPVPPAVVRDVRNATATRGAPWTSKELRVIDH